jgi:hypothetical protein
MNLRRSVKIAASAMMLMFAGLSGVHAEAPVINGVAYILLSKDFATTEFFASTTTTPGIPS